MIFTPSEGRRSFFPALEEFWEEVRNKTGLSLQRAKTEAFAWPGVELPGLPEGLSRAGETINQTFEDGFILYGIPIGTDIYVKHALDKKVDEIQLEACRAVDVRLRRDSAYGRCFAHPCWLSSSTGL